MSSYRIAPIFLIRATGIPFEVIERVATNASSACAREALAMQRETAHLHQIAEALISSRASALSAETSRLSRKILRGELEIDVADAALPEPVLRYREKAQTLAQLQSHLQSAVESDLAKARTALIAESINYLPDYLVFGAGEARERLGRLRGETASDAPNANRNARARENDRHLLLYLQRLATKNDTFSRFGPSAWGRIDHAGEPASLLKNDALVDARESFLERWTAHNLARAINQDPDARVELRPRLHPNGRVEGNLFLDCTTEIQTPLSQKMLSVLSQCDGETPAFQIGDLVSLEELASQKIILWELEVPALEAKAFEILAHEIERWRDDSAKAKWLPRAREIAQLPAQFTAQTAIEPRLETMSQARQLLEALGAGETKSGGRALYSASNPIAEECARTCEFRINEKLADEVALQAAPWFDLWQHTYCFVASRVAESLRHLLRSAPLTHGAISLPAFAAHCAQNKLPLTGPGLVAPAHLAFQEIKAAFRETMIARSYLPACEFTAAHCRQLRDKFPCPSFSAYTWPSADLQIGAKSFEALAWGNYQWIISELHPPVALLHHALYWSCPDKPALSAALTSTCDQMPNFHFGFTAADFTSHTTVRFFEALPELTYFVAPQRGNPKWKTVRPAEAEVFVDDATGDVGVRKIGSHEYLGSFARNWIIPLGFHPFHFGMAPHSPRLMCGNVVVQRRAWTVLEEELRPGNFNGISRDLVLAIEELRAARDLPRYVYIRPTEQALRRSGAEGRDKDTKPIFIDLESYLFLEIFHRWLKKAGEIEVTEMLPDPDHLCWHEADGRRTFELRTLVVPRS